MKEIRVALIATVSDTTNADYFISELVDHLRETFLITEEQIAYEIPPTSESKGNAA